MYSFKNDYGEGIHPELLDAIQTLSQETNEPYGTDKYCESVKKRVRELCDFPAAEVCFVSGGTTANVLVTAAFLRNSYEGIIATTLGHVNVHETGAIEYSGHKVCTVHCAPDGKMTPEMVNEVISSHESEHMVLPKLVYISNTTEMGGVYTKAELTALSEFCRANGLFLYMDGARLGSALTSEYGDLTFADIAHLVDAFYIGGTKNGLLMGEAVVFTNPKGSDHIRWIIKNHGFMLAKGFAVGALFDAALKDDLYFRMAAHANEKAGRIAACIKDCGIPFYTEPVSNQLFILLPDDKAAAIEAEYGCNIDRMPSLSEKGLAMARIVTSWATTDEGVESICAWLKNNCK